MALGLNDIKKNKVAKYTDFSSLDRQQPENREDQQTTNKPLRPWESFNETKHRTRTVGAQEAVRKARTIVEKNNAISATLLERALTKEQLDQNAARKLKIETEKAEFAKIGEPKELDFSFARTEHNQKSLSSVLKSFFGV